MPSLNIKKLNFYQLLRQQWFWNTPVLETRALSGGAKVWSTVTVVYPELHLKFASNGQGLKRRQHASSSDEKKVGFFCCCCCVSPRK